MSIQIFLGKGGQTFGPYDVTQYEAMRTQPDFSSYKYVWDGRDPQPAWKPLEAAPPSPMIGPGAPPPDDAQVAVAPAILAPPAPLAARQASPAPERVPAEERPLRVVRQIDGNGLEALCHDWRTVVSGRLTEITESGCRLLTEQASIEPGFGTKSRVTLNLLDPKTGETTNVSARLNGISRHDGCWSYRVTWQECPEMIARR